jgi:hypothetical protein
MRENDFLMIASAKHSEIVRMIEIREKRGLVSTVTGEGISETFKVRRMNNGVLLGMSQRVSSVNLKNC